MRSAVAVRNALLLTSLVIVLLYSFGLDGISDSLSPNTIILEEIYDQTKTAKVGSPTFQEGVRGDEEGTRFLEKIAAVVKAHLEQVKASLDRQIASEDGKTHIAELDPTVDPMVENIINDSTESEPETEFEVLNDQPHVAYPPEDRPYLAVHNFQFCDILEGATFFTDLELDAPGIRGTLDHTNALLFAQHIDWTAQQILAHPDFQKDFQRSSKFSETFETDSLKRGVCWNVAQGNLQYWGPYVDMNQTLEGKFAGRMLRTVDEKAALPFLNYDGQSGHPPFTSHNIKLHYRLAYVLMVHEKAENVAALLDALADPEAFVYIHIDLSSPPAFHQQIRDLVKDRQDVAIMPNPFAVTWGHISLIWAEIRAFFDLLDLISFDYVINLSGADYPLKSTKTIYEHLEKKPRSNWVWWRNDGGKNTDEVRWRFLNMFHCQLQAAGGEGACRFTSPALEKGYREFDGYKDVFPQLYKTSQWMILHRSAVEELRSSESAKLLLMHSEHTLIPDEMFFATFLASNSVNQRTFRDPKRLMYWRGGSHPYDWTGADEKLIKDCQSHFLWIRKVDVVGDTKLKKLLDDVRRDDTMSDRMVLKYKEGIIPVD